MYSVWLISDASNSRQMTNKLEIDGPVNVALCTRKNGIRVQLTICNNNSKFNLIKNVENCLIDFNKK